MKDYLTLNNEVLNEYNKTGTINKEKDREATRLYFLNEINMRTVFFHNLKEKLKYLTENNYYEKEFLEQYEFEFIKEVFNIAYSYKFRFPSFMSASKFYNNYALKTRDDKNYLERYEDRIAVSALYMAQGDKDKAKRNVKAIMEAYQPATPTFANLGKSARGEFVSCFELLVDDSMDNISHRIGNSLELSRLGGGVGLSLTDLRCAGDPIKGIENRASGIIPVAKLLEDSFNYANQQGVRKGSGVIYLNVFHGDIEQFISSKKPNADEKVRLATLSTGIIVPDVFFELVEKDKDMYLFSPYDIKKVYDKSMSEISMTDMYYELLDNPDIRKLKKLPARQLYTDIKKSQFESGYPFEMFDDNVNKNHPLKKIGRVKQSNLCVTGDAKLLTDKGYRTAKDLYDTQEDLKVVIDNRTTDFKIDSKGTKTVSAIPMQLTSKEADVYKIKTEQGFEIKATTWHKFYKQVDDHIVKIPLNELKTGDYLLTYSNYINDVDIIESIEYVGKEDVYDTTQEDYHSLIFNGIVTGNCSEILQFQEPTEITPYTEENKIGMDVSCNLGSLDIHASTKSKDFSELVKSSMEMLVAVSDMSAIDNVPSVARANRLTHSVGLGVMNLHGHLIDNEIMYGGKESVNFVDIYFTALNYATIKASMEIAKERGETFYRFEDSDYADGSYFEKYYDVTLAPMSEKVITALGNVPIITSQMWKELSEDVQKYGMYTSYRMATAPTGSISYIRSCTASLAPITEKVEVRDYQDSRTIYPMPFLTKENNDIYKEAYDINMFNLIDLYAAAQKHIDQGISMTLYIRDTWDTEQLAKVYLYAWKKGIKTVYYVRQRNTTVEECLSCSI